MTTRELLKNSLGFEVKREDGDVLIRDSDSSEWTSGVVWARSAPETVITMLADLWDASLCLELFRFP